MNSDKAQFLKTTVPAWDAEAKVPDGSHNEACGPRCRARSRMEASYG